MYSNIKSMLNNMDFFMSIDKQKSIISFKNEGGKEADEVTRTTIDRLNSQNERALLGIYTKSHATYENTRLARYVLQSRSAELLPMERVKNCLRFRISRDKSVSVKYNNIRKRAHYHNVQRCGSVWNCPVCSSKITEVRKSEVAMAVDKHLSTGGDYYMLTLTVPHYVGDNLTVLLDGLEKASKYFLNGTRQSKKVWADIGKIGHIKALEVTYGVNGWHPHYHFLIFTKTSVKNLDLTSIIEAWQNACRLAKLPIPSFKHGLDWRKGNYAEYVSKWGIESEITKGHIKRGRKDSLTAWDLLKISAFGTSDEEREKMGKLFQQFALSFKKRKQLVWSRGLKDLYGVSKKSDEMIVEETEKQSVDVMDLSDLIWSLLLRYEKRSDFLQCIEYDQLNGTDTVNDLINILIDFEVENLHKTT